MDNLEIAGRMLAHAFGYGTAWQARYVQSAGEWAPVRESRPAGVSLGGQLEEDAGSAIADGLPICRESETLERASDSVSAWLGRQDAHDPSPNQRRERAKLGPEKCAELWAWELANPLSKGQSANPYRPREYDHWKRTRSGAGVQVVRPMHQMHQCSLEALAGIPKPLQATLMLYATGDAAHYATAARFAHACLPLCDTEAMAEGMFRLLTCPSKRARSKERRMRESDWDEWSRPAFQLFQSWAQRAADAFLAALDKPPPTAGSQADGRRAETWWRPSVADRGGPPTSPKP